MTVSADRTVDVEESAAQWVGGAQRHRGPQPTPPQSLSGADGGAAQARKSVKPFRAAGR